MTYIDIAGLASDYQFTLRLQACCTQQANTFINDARPEFVSLSEQILADSGNATWFNWPVASAPSFGDLFAGGGSAAIGDDQILSAVQALWPTISNVHPKP